MQCSKQTEVHVYGNYMNETHWCLPIKMMYKEQLVHNCKLPNQFLHSFSRDYIEK